MKMTKNIIDYLKPYMESSKITANMTLQGDYICSIPVGNGTGTFFLYSKDFRMELRIFCHKHFGKNIKQSEIDEVIEYLELEAYKNKLNYNLAHRVFCEEDLVVYDLNQQDNSVVWVQDGKCSITQTDAILFKRSVTFANQITPDFNVKPKALVKYIDKHFNMKDRDKKLFMLYLVTCFMGLNINHPIIVLVGEKGAGKSTALRKLEKIIDPKQTDLCGIPKGNDGLELRLSNSYFVALDNLSYISRNISDTLARAVTGGSVTKRAMYQNTEEVTLNIKALLAINSVSMVVKESDLLDRSLLIDLRRIDPNTMKTEAEVWEDFEADLPKILGCCFKILAAAMQDTTPIKENRLTRMADFHVACIRVGKVLGYDEKEIADLLWYNQKKINREVLCEDEVAMCVIEIMEKQKIYVNSVAHLLSDLQQVAEEIGLAPSLLPSKPNVLSRRLNKIRSNLEQEYGIAISIINKGKYKEITIKRLPKKIENIESERNS